MDYLFKNKSYNIIGACMDVYNILRCGLSEPIYQDALEIEFELRNIPFDREKGLKVHYKDFVLQRTYRADFVCYDNIIVELKAIDELKSEHIAQVLNYLHITNFPLGLLINFGHKEHLEIKRLINTESTDRVHR